MYEYVTTFEDFKAAQSLSTRRSKRALLTFVMWYRIMPVIGLAALGLVVWDMSVRRFAFAPSVGALLFGLAWLGLFPLARFPFQMRSLYKRMKNDRTESSPVAVGVDGQELISRIPGVSEGRLLRSAVRRVVENDDLLLLYVSKNNFLFFPKRALPPQAVVEIKAWLEGLN